MLPNDYELLIDHLDKVQNGSGIPEAEHLINTDPEARLEWQSLVLGIDAVRYNSLYEQVGTVREQWKKERSAVGKPGTIVTMRNTMRVAAAVVLVAGLWLGYQYFTVTPSKMYSRYYAEYSLVTSRSSGGAEKMEQAWRNKNWQEVITAFNAADEKNNKAFFLSGLAYLQMQQPANAIQQFTHILSNNARTGDMYFREEAEYYLAMAYLSAGDGKEALDLLLKIKADKNHLYHSTVNEISGLDLEMMKLKFRR